MNSHNDTFLQSLLSSYFMNNTDFDVDNNQFQASSGCINFTSPFYDSNSQLNNIYEDKTTDNCLYSSLQNEKMKITEYSNNILNSKWTIGEHEINKFNIYPINNNNNINDFLNSDDNLTFRVKNDKNPRNNIENKEKAEEEYNFNEDKKILFSFEGFNNFIMQFINIRQILREIKVSECQIENNLNNINYQNSDNSEILTRKLRKRNPNLKNNKIEHLQGIFYNKIRTF